MQIIKTYLPLYFPNLAPIEYVQRGDQSPEPDNAPDSQLFTEVIHPLAKFHKQGGNQHGSPFLKVLSLFQPWCWSISALYL